MVIYSQQKHPPLVRRDFGLTISSLEVVVAMATGSSTGSLAVCLGHLCSRASTSPLAALHSLKDQKRFEVGPYLSLSNAINQSGRLCRTLSPTNNPHLHTCQHRSLSL